MKKVYPAPNFILVPGPSTAAGNKIPLDILSYICHYVTMQLVRTTLRLDSHLKKSAEMLALRNDQTFQEVLNQALAQYLTKVAKNDAKKIVFHTHNFGTPIENLTRDDVYGVPKL